mgnify:CR=1 FL=1
MRKYLKVLYAIAAVSLVTGCAAAVTPAGQKLNAVKEVVKPIVGKKLDAAADTSRTFICDDLPYKTEMRARDRWGVADDDFNGFCGRRSSGRPTLHAGNPKPG